MDRRTNKIIKVILMSILISSIVILVGNIGVVIFSIFNRGFSLGIIFHALLTILCIFIAIILIQERKRIKDIVDKTKVKYDKDEEINND